MSAADPHGSGARPGQRLEAGASIKTARMAVIMLHGRGASARDMTGLADHLAILDIVWWAPQAGGHSWWPQSFLAPLSANEPGLSSGLGAVQTMVDELQSEGFGPERLAILGFSQGACLALEFCARAGLPLAGIAGLSGGLIGTGEGDGEKGEDLYGFAPKRFGYDKRLDGVPVFLGCHAEDPHIPLARVRQSESIFGNLGADVTTQIYPGAGHGVVAEEIAALRGLLNRA